MISRHHRQARQQTGADGEEEGLEVVRMKELHALGGRGPRYGASTGEIESRRAIEAQRAQAAPSSFFAERIAQSGPHDRADQRRERLALRSGELEHGPIGAVEPGRLAQMEDRDHATSR